MWHGLYFRAFDMLAYDRTYGAFGGETPITYAAISQYCRDNGIEGEDLALFMVFFNAVDAEYLLMQHEAAEAKKKQQDQAGE